MSWQSLRNGVDGRIVIVILVNSIERESVSGEVIGRVLELLKKLGFVGVIF